MTYNVFGGALNFALSIYWHLVLWDSFFNPLGPSLWHLRPSLLRTLWPALPH